MAFKLFQFNESVCWTFCFNHSLSNAEKKNRQTNKQIRYNTCVSWNKTLCTFDWECNNIAALRITRHKEFLLLHIKMFNMRHSLRRTYQKKKIQIVLLLFHWALLLLILFCVAVCFHSSPFAILHQHTERCVRPYRMLWHGMG